ncbi:MAG: enoyl-CoA hydratase-related protein [Sneathiellaceae bacterium]
MSDRLPDCTALALERRGSVLHVTLNRPDTRNAMDGTMVAELLAVTQAVRGDRALRTLVLRGAGGTFCAGGDIKGFKSSMQASVPEPGAPDPVVRQNREFGDFLIALNELPQTVVMVVEGAAFGGGLGLVCVSDIAIAAADTRFALSETGLGLPPAQIAPFVVQRIGLTQARRLMMSGARFDGARALALGLVHEVEADPAALNVTLARVLNQIGRCAPGANAATKEILFAAQRQDLPDVLDMAALHFAACMRGPEGREGVAAFLEKRPAQWVEKVG